MGNKETLFAIQPRRAHSPPPKQGRRTELVKSNSELAACNEG